MQLRLTEDSLPTWPNHFHTQKILSVERKERARCLLPVGGHEIRLPKRREEDASETGEVNLLEEMGSEARVIRIEGMYLALEPALALLRRRTKEEWTDKRRNVARKPFLEGGWVQKKTIRYWLVD